MWGQEDRTVSALTLRVLLQSRQEPIPPVEGHSTMLLKGAQGMGTEDSSVSLTAIEVELLLSSLAHYELKFRDGRVERLAAVIRKLRAKLLGM